MTKTCLILIGLPGSGKTTYRNQLEEGLKTLKISYSIISTDDPVEQVAKQKGITYKEAFDATIKESSERAAAALLLSRYHDFVIVDQTNLTTRKRRHIINTLGNEFTYYAIVFTPPSEVITQRNDERKALGRSIPDEVMKRMAQAYNPPMMSEGYTMIFYAGVDPNIEKLTDNIFFQD